MTIWKKAISAVTSAALLASLLATSAVGTIGGATTDSDQTDHLACYSAAVHTLVTCSQVADGISTVTLVGDPTGDVTAGTSLYISATGATIISAGGDFVLSGGVVTAAPPINLATDDTIVFRAPAAAGTAVVSVYQISTATGIATLEGTLTITFTATSGLGVSEANSTVKFVEYNAACSATALPANVAPKGLNPAAKLCVLVKDGNGAAVTTAKVKAQITPVGLIAASDATAVAAPAGTAQIAETAVNTIAGWYAFGVGGSGLSGSASIGISVTLAGVVTTFAPKTFVFSDVVASVTATNLMYALNKADLTAHPAVYFTMKDAAGNAVKSGDDLAAVPPVVATTVAVSASSIISATVTKAYGGDPDVPGEVSVACKGVEGSATVTVTNNKISSSPVTIYCSGGVDTYTAAFDKTTVNPGGSAILTVTAKDAAGQPAYDSSATVSSTVVSAGALGTWSTVKNGMTKATYLAPFNAGVVTVLVSLSKSTTTVGPVSASLTVGAPAPVATLGSTASTLGVAPPGGSWSTSTKVAKVGSFITWRFAAGVANAGKTIGVFLQTKDANGVWSAPVRFSARVADSSGNAYFSWKGTKAMWVSIRGGLGDLRSTPPVQGRWQ